MTAQRSTTAPAAAAAPAAVLSKLLTNCASITERCLSLKTLVPFQDIDNATEEQREISKWLDRQQLDYDNNSNKNNNNNNNNKTSGSSNGMSVVTPHAHASMKKLHADLLERTWDQHLQHLFIRRIRMASSAQVALNDGDDLASLTKEALQSRDVLADLVTKRQYELIQLREHLETVTRRARLVQDENRALWAKLQSNQAIATAKANPCARDGATLSQQNRLLKYILADLIVGTDHLYTDERIAQTFLKLAE